MQHQLLRLSKGHETRRNASLSQHWFTRRGLDFAFCDLARALLAPLPHPFSQIQSQSKPVNMTKTKTSNAPRKSKAAGRRLSVLTRRLRRLYLHVFRRQ
jgi:hypothetical protein